MSVPLHAVHYKDMGDGAMAFSLAFIVDGEQYRNAALIAPGSDNVEVARVLVALANWAATVYDRHHVTSAGGADGDAPEERGDSPDGRTR